MHDRIVSLRAVSAVDVTCASVVLAAALATGYAIWASVTTALLALLGATFLAFTFWRHPRFAFVAWMLSVTMLPIWLSVDFIATVPFHCIVGILAIIATYKQAATRFTIFDAYFALFVITAFGVVIIGGASAAFWTQILVRWALPYATARILISAAGPRFALKATAVIFSVVGALAVVEFFAGWHPYTSWNSGTSEFLTWNAIQLRAGGDRSEWAFGHSIALGGSLAVVLPFVLRSSRIGVVAKVFMLIALCAGIYATASRGAMITAAFTLAICAVYTIRQKVLRAALIVAATVSVVFVMSSAQPLLESWIRGGSDEERSSFDYRSYLYERYLPGIEWFGQSPVYNTGGSGYHSTDSAFLVIGLRFGWIVLALAVIPLFIAAARVVAGKASSAEVAIVGQIPLFTTVALITQYESIVFIVAAYAVQFVAAPRLYRHDTSNSSILSPRISEAGPLMGAAK